jgi:hypothetical protein
MKIKPSPNHNAINWLNKHIVQMTIADKIYVVYYNRMNYLVQPLKSLNNYLLDLLLVGCW